MVPILDFFKRIQPWFSSKIGKISFQFDFGQMSLEIIMFEDHPIRKQAFLVSTNIDFTQWTYWDFFKEVNPWFWSKIGKISSQFDFGQMSLEIVFEDHPVRKQAFLTSLYKYWFYTVDTLRFFKMINSWFWRKIGNFLFACFWTKISLEDDHLVIK